MTGWRHNLHVCVIVPVRALAVNPSSIRGAAQRYAKVCGILEESAAGRERNISGVDSQQACGRRGPEVGRLDGAPPSPPPSFGCG